MKGQISNESDSQWEKLAYRLLDGDCNCKEEEMYLSRMNHSENFKDTYDREKCYKDFLQCKLQRMKVSQGLVMKIKSMIVNIPD